MPRTVEPLRMTIVCHLREMRRGRRILELAEITGISAGTLSQLENGQRYPRPEWVASLELGYGRQRDWYSVEVS